MNIYNENLLYLLDQRKISITEFENIIYIPKVRILDPTPDELIRISDYFNISLDVLLRKKIKRQSEVKAIDVQLVILDIDGTMTDGGMYFTENGDQIKKYNTKDGLAIISKVRTGLTFGIISHGRKENMIRNRAALLEIDRIYVGTEPKMDILSSWCSELGIGLENVAFIGDDINDLPVLEKVGVSACPNDASEAVKKVSDIILTKGGGKGCIREFIDDWLN
ncbi:MAG: HAD hydrolase family protein [Flavobacteriales bacterium]|nr:HAD hydrolase family protein [Flavobacteriales bacterium]